MTSLSPRLPHCSATILLLLLALSCRGDGYISNAPITARLDVPYVPTPEPVVQRMLEMAELQPDDYLVDLGSGDGRIVVAAVRDWGLKRALGIDIDPTRIEEAEANAQRAGVSGRALFEQGDIFRKDFSDADVLTLYLLPDVNARLQPVILEMAPGTRIVSHAFDMNHWQPDEQDMVEGKLIYKWIVPAKVAGQWRIESPEGEAIDLSLTQEYQELDGEALVGGQSVPLRHATLRGENIRFWIGPDFYVGRVQGDRMAAVDEAEAMKGWHARRL